MAREELADLLRNARSEITRAEMEAVCCYPDPVDNIAALGHVTMAIRALTTVSQRLTAAYCEQEAPLPDRLRAY